MKRTAILIAALGGALLGTQAQAQSSGVYVGAGVSSVWSHAGEVYSDTINEDVSTGGKVYAGYKWDRFAAELSLNNLGTYEAFFAGAKISEMKTTALALSGVYGWPIAPGYIIHTKLGIVFTESKYTCESLCGAGGPPNVDTRKRGVAGVFGLGLNMLLTEHFSVRVDFDHFGNIKHAVSTTEFNEAHDVMSVSLQVNF